MATGVAYPTADHVSGEFTNGLTERAEGQDVDPVAIRREQLLAELEALGVKPPSAETPEEQVARLQAELEGLGGSDAGETSDEKIARLEAELAAKGSVPGA
jgi:uncharacterized small protein (DUF1192 family)